MASMNELIVNASFYITNRGTAVLFEVDPIPWWSWQPHQVRVTKPNGESFEATAHVEFARKVPPGEVMGLLFLEHETSEIPIGSRIRALGTVNNS
jgi:hypothetical protein